MRLGGHGDEGEEDGGLVNLDDSLSSCWYSGQQFPSPQLVGSGMS